MSFWQNLITDLKNHPGVVASAFIAGIVATGTVAGAVWMATSGRYAVLLNDTYVLRTEIERSYVAREAYILLDGELKVVRAENSDLRSRLAQSDNSLSMAQSKSNSVICRRLDTDLDRLTTELNLAEASIRRALSPEQGYLIDVRKKTEEQMVADKVLAQQLRLQANDLNMQISQIRKEMWKCAG